MSEDENTEEDPFLAMSGMDSDSDESFKEIEILLQKSNEKSPMIPAKKPEPPPAEIASKPETKIPDIPSSSSSPKPIIAKKKQKRRRAPIQKHTIFSNFNLDDDAILSPSPNHSDDEKPPPKQTLKTPEKKKEKIEKPKIIISPTQSDDSFSFDSQNDSPPSPIRSPSSSPPMNKSTMGTPMEMFEYAVVSYLNNEIMNLKNSFIDEFSLLVKDTFTIDSKIGDFIDEINQELKQLFPDNQDIQRENSIPKSTMELEFDQLVSLVPKVSKIETKKTDPSYIIVDEAKSTFKIANEEILSELTNEWSELQLNRVKLTDGQTSLILEQKSEHYVENEAQLIAMEIEHQYIQKKINILKAKQASFHEQNVRNLAFDTDSNEDQEGFQESFDELVNIVEQCNPNKTFNRFINFSQDTKSKLTEVSLLNDRLYAGVNKVCNTLSIVQSHYSQGQIIPRPRMDEPKSDLVADVRARLASLRKEREITMKEIGHITFENV